MGHSRAGRGGGGAEARVGAQEPEVAKEAPRRRAGIAHAEEAAVTLSAEDLEQPPPGRAHAQTHAARGERRRMLISTERRAGDRVGMEQTAGYKSD